MPECNRRRYPRVAIEAGREIYHPALGMLYVDAQNVSEGGFFASRTQAAELPPVGTLVEVTIRRYTGVLNDCPVTMRVAYISEQGMGLEITAA